MRRLETTPRRIGFTVQNFRGVRPTPASASFPAASIPPVLARTVTRTGSFDRYALSMDVDDSVRHTEIDSHTHATDASHHKGIPLAEGVA
jgi:hypothetical protein